MKKSIQYDEAFKEQAVKLSYKTSILEAAREFGVSYGSIVRWRKKYTEKMDDNAGQTSVGQLTEEDSENVAMGACILFGWLWPFW